MKIFVNVSLCMIMLCFASYNMLEDVFDHVEDKKDGDHPEFATDEIGSLHLFLANQEGELPNEPDKLLFEAPGFTEDFAYEVAEGVPGGNHGFLSSFVAGSDGKAVYSEMLPKGEMSFLGSVTHCLLNEYEEHIVGAFHLDGHTYGGELGPDGKAIEQFGLVYMN